MSTSKPTEILLVQPRTPRTFWTLDSLVEACGFKTIMPPLGLMTVAAMLPDGYRPRILDLNTAPLDEASLARADLVFVTGMYIHHASFVQVVALARKLGKTVVAGGPFAIAEWVNQQDGNRGLLDMEQVDHLILYEAETNLPPFLRDLERGCAKKVYADHSFPALDTSPPPRFDLVNIEDYMIMSLQFSRGCPHSCEFCDIIKMFGRVPRTKPVDRFIDEMNRLYASGFRGYLFVVDDNFIGNKRAAKQLLREIAPWQQQRGYPFVLLTETTLALASDDELLRLMLEAGVITVFIGIETPDAETLRASRKTVNTRLEMDQAVEKIQRTGIEVMGGFIIGFDTDGEDIFQRQIDFIQSAAIPMSMFGLLSPIPGTELYERLLREGRTLARSDEPLKDATGDNVVAALNFVPRMPVKRLLQGFRRVLSEIYDPLLYYRRSLTVISRLPGLRLRDLARMEGWRRRRALARATAAPLTPALARRMLRILRTPHGRHYAAFLARAAGHGLMALPYAFTLALSAEHFFDIRKMVGENLTDEYIDKVAAEIDRRRQPQPKSGVPG